VGRKVDLDDLVDARQVSERLGVSRPQVVHVWRDRYPDFPPPAVERAHAILWVWPDVEKWARATGRLPKRN
jgi:predicted DNA-binding transcriptional regulator AlpA